MAITQLPSKHWQFKIRGSDGRWISETLASRRDAELAEAKAKARVLGGSYVQDRTTVSEFFPVWYEHQNSSRGWLHDQRRRFEMYVEPFIGPARLSAVTPAMIGRILQEARRRGQSEQSCLHVYNLLHKIFGDAVEMFLCLNQSPVIKSLRPRPPEKEAKHLLVQDVVRLLQHVEGKSYELAIWLGVYVGLRVGEIQALRWENVDLENGIIHVRATYCRKERVIKDYPKGRKWHRHAIPPELLQKLRDAKRQSSGNFVVRSPEQPMLNYDGYRAAIKRYCKEAGVPLICTHGLRHSTAGVYMASGATRDDLLKLFRHSSRAVTDRYIHDAGEHVDQVARVIRLFPERPTETPCSTNVPREAVTPVERKNGMC